MGKKRRERPEKHKQSLGDQLENPESWGIRTQPRPDKKRRSTADSDDDNEDEFVPPTLSNKILEEARVQQQEEENEEDIKQKDSDAHTRNAVNAAVAKLAGAITHNIDESSDDDDDDDIGKDLDPKYFNDDVSDPGSGYDEDEWEHEITAEEEAALEAFMAPGSKDQKQKTLSDLIMEKIKEKQQQAGIVTSEGDAHTTTPQHLGIDPKVVEVYRGVGTVLSRYTTGKVPKAFKVIPNLKNWEEILFLTEPDAWSPHAVYQATRLFVSNLNAKMAQRFLALVLLPAIRYDIRENRRLHHALFQALKKSTYKAGAFYKGVLLPLCASETCTLREAVIITSVLRRSSIPVLHSAAALLRIAEMPYSGVNSFFIRVLLDKRYALPYRVIDALVDHFAAFTKEERQLPVVWHQSLLCFVQRYKAEIRREDKDALRALCRAQHHYQVTPEVLRELDVSRSRGEAAVAGGVDASAVLDGSGGGKSSKKVHDQMFVKGNGGGTKIGSKVVENVKDLAPMIMMDD